MFYKELALSRGMQRGAESRYLTRLTRTALAQAQCNLVAGVCYAVGTRPSRTVTIGSVEGGVDLYLVRAFIPTQYLGLCDGMAPP